MINKIFYLTNDPERAIGLEQLIPGFQIICIDHNAMVDELLNRGLKVFCLEKELRDKNVIFRNSNRLLSHPKTIQYLKKNCDPEKDFLMTFKISPAFERTASTLGLRILNTTSKLNRRFENKLSQHDFLSGLALSIPKSFVRILEETEIEEITTKLGKPFVIQFDRGHTGTGTHFVETKIEYDVIKKHFPKSKVKFSEFIEGDPWTLNAVTTSLGVFYGGLAYQITGIQELTDKEGATVGNDWTKVKELSAGQTEKIKYMTDTIGKEMYKAGFQGMFGLDLIINDNGVYLIEINARQPASTSIHTKLMLESDQIPIELLHICEFIDSKRIEEMVYKLIGSKLTDHTLAEKLELQNRSINSRYNASQFIIRNNRSSKVILDEKIKSGVYNMDHTFLKSGYSIEDLSNNEQYLLITTARGRYISQGSEIARVQMKETVLGNDKELKKEFKDLVSALNSNIVETE